MSRKIKGWSRATLQFRATESPDARDAFCKTDQQWRDNALLRRLHLIATGDVERYGARHGTQMWDDSVIKLECRDAAARIESLQAENRQLRRLRRADTVIEEFGDSALAARDARIRELEARAEQSDETISRLLQAKAKAPVAQQPPPDDAIRACIDALRRVAELENGLLPDDVFRAVDQALERVDTTPTAQDWTEEAPPTENHKEG